MIVQRATRRRWRPSGSPCKQLGECEPHGSCTPSALCVEPVGASGLCCSPRAARRVSGGKKAAGVAWRQVKTNWATGDEAPPKAGRGSPYRAAFLVFPGIPGAALAARANGAQPEPKLCVDSPGQPVSGCLYLGTGLRVPAAGLPRSTSGGRRGLEDLATRARAGGGSGAADPAVPRPAANFQLNRVLFDHDSLYKGCWRSVSSLRSAEPHPQNHGVCPPPAPLMGLQSGSACVYFFGIQHTAQSGWIPGSLPAARLGTSVGSRQGGGGPMLPLRLYSLAMRWRSGQSLHTVAMQIGPKGALVRACDSQWEEGRP